MTKKTQGFPEHLKPTAETDLQYSPLKTFLPSLRKCFPKSATAGMYQKTAQRNLGRYRNDFSIKECLAKIYTKLDSTLKCKERPGRIHLLSTSNRLFRRKSDISEFF